MSKGGSQTPIAKAQQAHRNGDTDDNNPPPPAGIKPWDGQMNHPDDGQRRRIRDAYLEPWTAYGSLIIYERIPRQRGDMSSIRNLISKTKKSAFVCEMNMA
jgi:hypothetical protein